MRVIEPARRARWGDVRLMVNPCRTTSTHRGSHRGTESGSVDAPYETTKLLYLPYALEGIPRALVVVLGANWEHRGIRLYVRLRD